MLRHEPVVAPELTDKRLYFVRLYLYNEAVAAGAVLRRYYQLLPWVCQEYLNHIKPVAKLLLALVKNLMPSHLIRKSTLVVVVLSIILGLVTCVTSFFVEGLAARLAILLLYL